VTIERLYDPERAQPKGYRVLSPRYTATHVRPRLPRNANRSARKRASLAAATAVAAAGIGAVTASAGTAHWINAISNLADNHVSSTAPAAGAASRGVPDVTQAHLDAFIPAPEIGIAGTLQFGAAPAHGSTTAFGNIATGQQPDDTATDSSVKTPHAPAALGAAPAAAARSAPAHIGPAPAHAAPAPAHAGPAPAHVGPAPAHAGPAPAHAAPAQARPAAHAAPAPARPAAHAAPAPARRAQAPAAPPKPYLLYDSVTPSVIPPHQQIATYANGAYAASPSSIAGRGHVLWIDTNGSDPAANALDVEPGDATPAGAAMWVKTKLTADHGATAIVYTMISDWQSVKANVAGLPTWMQSHVRYWIADPTGVPHVVPGSNATQWYWGNSYDITTANPGFQG
jgi:hypothetical protein